MYKTFFAESAGESSRPVTDEILHAAESKWGIRLPVELAALLRTRNGGLLENFDFRFLGKSFSVSRILSLSETEHSDSMRPVSELMQEYSTDDGTPKTSKDPSRLIYF